MGNKICHISFSCKKISAPLAETTAILAPWSIVNPCYIVLKSVFCSCLSCSQKQHMQFWMFQVNVSAFWKLASWPQSIATSQIHDQQLPVQILIQTIAWKCKKRPGNKNNPCPHPPSPPPPLRPHGYGLNFFKILPHHSYCISFYRD